jgi:hypothetical protein
MRSFKFFQRSKPPITNLVAVVSPSFRRFINWRNTNYPGFESVSRGSNRYTHLGTEYIYVGNLHDVIGRRFTGYIDLGYFYNMREYREIIDMLRTRIVINETI